ncbi:hypothetical protein [Croceibacterium salegens]|nr:hypothetical protein [Croceibacterium salegens]
MLGNPGHYAVLIATCGLGADVSLPATTARQFHDWLANPLGGGLSPDRIHFLAPGPEKREEDPPTYAVTRTFAQLGLGASGIIGERLYLYLSGRGQRIAGATQLVLTARDAMPTIIDVGQLVDHIRRSGAFRQLVVVADLQAALPIDPGSARQIIDFPITESRILSEISDVRFVDLAYEDGQAGRLTAALVAALLGNPAHSHHLIDAVNARIAATGPTSAQAIEISSSGPPIDFASRPASGELIVEAPHWAAEIQVVDGAGSIVRALGPCETMANGRRGITLSVPVGAFEVTAKLEEQSASQLVAVGSGRLVRIAALSWNMRPAFAAPLHGAAKFRRDQARAAVKWSVIPDSLSKPDANSRLFLFVRALQPERMEDIASSLEILDAQGIQVANLAKESQIGRKKRWLTFCRDLPAGHYVLHRRGCEAVPERFHSLHLADGWSTQIFIPARHFPSLRNLAVHLARPNVPFDPKSQSAMAAELVADCLQRNRPIGEVIASGEIEQLLDNETANPMLGILAAHALRLHAASAPDHRSSGSFKFDAIIDFLGRVLPDHPDVRALRLAREEILDTPFWEPPTLRAGLAIVKDAAVRTSGIIGLGSLTETLLSAALDNSAWTSWHQLAQAPRQMLGDSTAASSTIPAFMGGNQGGDDRLVRDDPLPLRHDAEPDPVQKTVGTLENLSLLQEVRTIIDQADALPVQLRIDPRKSARDLIDAAQPEALSEATGLPLDRVSQELRSLQAATDGNETDPALTSVVGQKRLLGELARHSLANDATLSSLAASVGGPPSDAPTIDETASRLLAEANRLAVTAQSPDHAQTPEGPALAEASESLRKSAANLLKSADFVAITDAAGKVQFANGAFQAIVGGPTSPHVDDWESFFSKHNLGAARVEQVPVAVNPGMTFGEGDRMLQRTELLGPDQNTTGFINILKSSFAQLNLDEKLKGVDEAVSRLSLYSSIYSHTEGGSDYREQLSSAVLAITKLTDEF